MEKTKTLYQKFLEAQKKTAAVSKSKDNPFFKSKYADINIYLSQVKPVLNEVGLVLMQPIIFIEGRHMLETILIDSESGEQLKSVMLIPEGTDIQKFGAGITYIRRYAIQSLLALEAEDDDGNTATGKKSSPAPRQTANKAMQDFEASLDKDLQEGKAGSATGL